MFVDSFKRAGVLTRQSCERAACRQTVLLALLELSIAFTPQTEACSIKDELHLDSVMPERFVSVRHNYNTQQVQDK